MEQLHSHIVLTPDWINYALLDDITDSFASPIQTIQYEVDSIDELVLLLRESETNDMLRRIGSCRKNVMALSRLLSNKADVVRGLMKRFDERFAVAIPTATTVLAGSPGSAAVATGAVGGATPAAAATATPSGGKAEDNIGSLIQYQHHRDGEILLYLGDILDHVLTMLQSLWSYEKILDRSHSNYLAQISLEINQLSNKTNEVMGTLTFFASLIVPMTFITGLWGSYNMAEPHQFRVLEFYSGIGGMHYSFNESGHQGQILKAFDINTTANEVYAHNHGKKQLAQRNIEAVPIEFYDKQQADVWLMSPPCQPYTRTGNQEGSKDTRAKSFLYLMDILPKLNHPPNYILLENVKGFEESDSRDILVESLSGAGYEFQELLITPLQIGIPNSRMRYYCLARKIEKVGSFVQKVTGTLIGYIPSLDSSQPSSAAEGEDKGEMDGEEEEEKEQGPKDFVDGRKQGDLSGLSTSTAAKKRRTSLSTSTVTKDGSEDTAKKPDEDSILADPMLALKVETLEKYIEFKDVEDERMKRYMIPDKTLLKYGRLFDIVKESTRRSCCFTKGYYHFVESTGSILQLVHEKDTATVFDEAEALKAKANADPTTADENNAKALTLLRTLGLRYFTENEVARLMGFPIMEGKFSFPATTSLKQRYRVLGNSINVKVVSQLVRYLLTSKESKEDDK
ncbi:tRNA (cytosine-5-)-methyltransferase [Dissophora ornata]|nr:tRNA (cytosine-5-)-methyltransferase [Dissophora ornata]